MAGWGLIGASNIARAYMIRAFRAQDGHDVVNVMSTDAARGAAFAKENDIPRSTTSLDDLLADPEVDCIYISTTNEKHFDQAMASIAAGKHVVCEKPLAMSLNDAEAMVAAAKEKGVVFATNHHLRNAGTHLAIKDAVKAGKIGDVLSMRILHSVYLPEFLQGWRIDNPGAGGGVVLDVMVHDADTTRFHLDEDPKTVMSINSASGMGQGVEDSAMSVMEMPSGVMVFTHESFTHAYAGTGLEIHGTKGSIRARHVMTQEPVGDIALTTDAGDEAITYSDHDLYIRSMGMFADAIKGKGQPSADGVDGVKSLAIALAGLESAETGKRVTIDYGKFGG